MTRKTRVILFLFLAFLFFLTAPLTIFYSLGWRFDWETGKFFQPGIFYFKVWPKSAEIYLNGRLKKKTDFFFGSALIENLAPKKYEVEIKKEGFHSWKKTLEIKEGMATEGKNIILVPENPNFVSLTKGVKNFFFSPDEKKIILEEEKLDSENLDNPNWTLKLFELEKNVKSFLIEEKDISQKETQLVDVNFSPDSKRVLLEVDLGGKLEFYTLEIDKTPPILTYLDFLPPGVEKVYFNPKNSEKLFILKERSLSEADLISETISPFVLENVIAIYFSENDIYWLDESGFILKTDFSFAGREKLNIIPFPLKQETEYKITVFPPYVVLKEADILYIFDKDKKLFKKLSEQVKNFRFSPDFKKLVYFNNYEIWILFLEKTYAQPQKETGEQLFLTRFSEKIDDVFWYTNHYLVFKVEDKIKIAEIDDRDRINIFDLIEFKESIIFWSQTNKKLYILSEENLYASNKLIP